MAFDPSKQSEILGAPAYTLYPMSTFSWFCLIFPIVPDHLPLRIKRVDLSSAEVRSRSI